MAFTVLSLDIMMQFDALFTIREHYVDVFHCAPLVFAVKLKMLDEGKHAAAYVYERARNAGTTIVVSIVAHMLFSFAHYAIQWRGIANKYKKSSN